MSASSTNVLSANQTFPAVTAQPERVVGAVPGHDPHAGLDVLGRRSHCVIQSHTARKEGEAVAALTVAHADGRVVAGIADVWPAVLGGQRGTLFVEEPGTYPARLTGDGLSLHPAPPEGGVVADAIGELAWAVKFYGGDIIVVPDGTLGNCEGIALVLDGEPTPAASLVAPTSQPTQPNQRRSLTATHQRR
jgi:hypothetical protein